MIATSPMRRSARRAAAAVLIGVALAAAVFFAISSFRIGLPSFITGTPYQEVGPTVIQSIQDLSELTSVEMVEYTTIERGQDHGILNFLAGDRIFMFAVARIGAGVDLGKVGPESFVVGDDGTVIVRLPEPEVFYSYLDSEATTVVDRDTGLLTKGDRMLETEARREAESILLQQAIAAGILDTARENAEETIAGFLHGLGYEHVVIERNIIP